MLVFLTILYLVNQKLKTEIVKYDGTLSRLLKKLVEITYTHLILLGKTKLPSVANMK